MMKPGTVMPGSSGVSLNFDAQALHDAEEREYQREELERQKELQELLTTAFDDLSDDDDSQMTNDGASNASHESDGEQKSEHMWTNRPLPGTGTFGLGHTSTPLAGTAPPPLVTPAHYSTGQGYMASGQYGYMPVAGQQYGYQGLGMPGVAPLGDEERGQGEGGNEEDQYYDPATQGNAYAYNHAGGMHMMDNLDGHMDPQAQNAGYHDNQNYGPGTAGPPSYYPSHGYYMDPVDPTGVTLSVGEAAHQFPQQLPVYSMAGEAPSSAPLPPPSQENYVVKYHPTEDTGPKQHSGERDVPPHSPTKIPSPPAKISPVKEMEDMQKDFLSQGGSPESRRLGQLQVLYNARGRKIEELDRELKSTTESSEREIRILKHKLALSADERDGLNANLGNAQQLLRDMKSKENEMTGKMAALETQITTLGKAKEELVKKLQQSESTIEQLNVQLEDLGRSDSLARAREQHESVVAGMQRKHDTEVLSLKEKLDAANQDRQEKMDEVLSLKKQLGELQKGSEEQHIDRADTINRLTRSLEESQRHCTQLIESGAGQEMAKLKLQLQDTIAGKSIAEDMNSALQDEMKELREQLTMYESASQFGIFPNSSTNPSIGALDDSYAQLGIRKSQPAPVWRTPDSAASEPSSTLSSEQTVHGLRAELERCLSNYRNKRQQVVTLQEELNATKSTLDSTQRRMEAAEKEAKKATEKLGSVEEEVSSMKNVGMTLKETRLHKEIESLKKEKEILLQEIEELNKRIEEIASSEEQTKQANRELSAQMAQMVHEFDEDKRQALDKCQDACLQHHQAAKAQLQEHLLAEFQEDKQKWMVEQEGTMSKLKEELADAQRELDEVKALYVEVCEVKDQLEQDQDAAVQDMVQKEMDQLKHKLTEEKESELAAQKLSLDKSHEVAQRNAKAQWLVEQQEGAKQKLEEELAKSKVSWFDEHQREKEAAVQSAVSTIERHWQQKFDSEMELEVQAKIMKERNQWEEHQKSVFEHELERRLASAQRTWRETKLTSELDKQLNAVNEAKIKDNNNKEAGTEQSEAFDLALLKAKHEWQTEQQRGWDEAADVLRRTAAKEAREDMEEEVARLAKELEVLQATKCDLERQVMAHENTWREKREALISQKDAERRLAVAEVTNQCEKDYREFLHEHQDTLTKALKAAREQFAKEKHEIFKKHQEEVQALRDKDMKLMEAERKHHQECDTLVSEHKSQLQAVTQQHEAEKERLTSEHRKSLAHALEEAHSRWQKKYTESLLDSKTSSEFEGSPNWQKKYQDLKVKFEKQWQEKVAEYESELETLQCQQEEQLEAHRREYAQKLEEQEKLLQSADSHLEAEVSKLQDDLLRSHQGELSALQAKLEASHQIELTEELARVQIQVEAETRSAAQDNAEEAKALAQQLEDARSQLAELERSYAKEVSTLQKVIAKREQELQGMQSELADIKGMVEDYHRNQETSTQQLQECRMELSRTKKQRQELVLAYKKMEASHQQVTESYLQRHKELAEKVQRTEQKLKTAMTSAQTQVESMERERAQAVEKLKVKMGEMRESNMEALEKLRQAQATERRELQETIEQLKQQAPRVHTPTQTESETLETQAVHEIRAYYVDIIARMRGDVMQHLSSSNERAAETVRSEMVRDRQKTAKRLRRYYMKCLGRMLDQDCTGLSKEDKMALMERALDNLPEKGSSSGSSSTRSTRSTASAPLHRPQPGTATQPVSFSSQAAARLSPDSQRIAKLGSQLSVFSSLPHSDRKSRTASSGSASGSRSRSADRDFGMLLHETQKRSRDAGSRTTDPWESEASELLNTGSSLGSIAGWRHHREGSSSSSRPSSAPSKRSGLTLPLESELQRDSRPNSAGSSRSLSLYQGAKHSPTRPDGSDGPRKYYDIDIDMVSQADECSNSLSPRSPRVAGLTKLNSDTFLLTPSKPGRHTGMHGSVSMGDVRMGGQLSDFTASKISVCKSDDALDSSLDVSRVSTNVPYRYTSLRQAYNQGGLSQKATGKCLSMPDVGDESWTLPDNLYQASSRHDNYSESSSRSHQDISDHHDNHLATPSTNLNRFQSQENLPSARTDLVKHKARHKVSTLIDNFNTPYRAAKKYESIYRDEDSRSTSQDRRSESTSRDRRSQSGSRDKRSGSTSRDRGHHVSFKNIDLNSSGEYSDGSVKSSTSTNSVHSFRLALKSKSTGSSSHGKSSRNPMRVPRSGGEANSDSDPVHRPKPMCTRTTQAPSPLPHKKK